MKNHLVFPVVSLLFLLAACGVPTAQFDKAVADLAACSKERDGAISQTSTCKKQLEEITESLKIAESKANTASGHAIGCQVEAKGLRAENAAMLAEKDELKKERDALKARVSELTGKAAELEKANASIYQDLRKKLEKEIQEGKIQIAEMKNKLTMTMVDKILFPSGSAEVSKDGKAVLDKVISILKDVADKRIQVEGHTDNMRIISAVKAKYPTNWELSTARATQVVRYLQEAGGIDPKRLSAAGFSEYQPVSPNDTDEGKAKNRRIEIVLLPLLN